MRRLTILMAAFAALALAMPHAGWAQTRYPDKPVRIIVPSTPAGVRNRSVPVLTYVLRTTCPSSYM